VFVIRAEVRPIVLTVFRSLDLSVEEEIVFSFSAANAYGFFL